MMHTPVSQTRSSQLRKNSNAAVSMNTSNATKHRCQKEAERVNITNASKNTNTSRSHTKSVYHQSQNNLEQVNYLKDIQNLRKDIDRKEVRNEGMMAEMQVSVVHITALSLILLLTI